MPVRSPWATFWPDLLATFCGVALSLSGAATFRWLAFLRRRREDAIVSHHALVEVLNWMSDARKELNFCADALEQGLFPSTMPIDDGGWSAVSGLITRHAIEPGYRLALNRFAHDITVFNAQFQAFERQVNGPGPLELVPGQEPAGFQLGLIRDARNIAGKVQWVFRAVEEAARSTSPMREAPK